MKTNRRDALSLVKLLRAGELTAVWVPDERHEAMRDLVRARDAAVKDLRIKRQQVSSLLLRLGRHYPGKKTWARAHMNWLGEPEARAPRAAHRLRGDAVGGAAGPGADRAVGAGDPRGGAGLVAGTGR